ncbi:calcium-dependent phosphotriesterase [Tothia fuscella]|uniref:Calcium-dependent phosphotriesterase n=1 Tax=Tothia fuscella TaxID=1048955 RepID=A0A9P4TY07_9PEZI|nr:calcium-dependent phosphotriesterase [Tothia fuscella]
MATQSTTPITLTPQPWAEGLIFGESPRWHAPSSKLYISDMIGCKIYTIDSSGKPDVLKVVENQPNGMCFLDANTLITSSMFDAKLHRYQLDTGSSELYAELSSGHVFIDDTGARVLHGEAPRPGRLLMVDPQTQRVTSVAEDIVFPNGIVIDATGKNLYLGATFSYDLLKFSLDNDTGALTHRQAIWDTHDLAPMARKPFDRFCGIDGICIDAEDGLWISMLGWQMFIRRDKHGNITHKIYVDGDATACVLGSSLRIAAMYSLVSRASLAHAAGSFRIHAPGAVRDSMLVATPCFSAKASSNCTDHLGISQPEGSPPLATTAIVKY